MLCMVWNRFELSLGSDEGKVDWQVGWKSCRQVDVLDVYMCERRRRGDAWIGEVGKERRERLVMWVLGGGRGRGACG